MSQTKHFDKLTAAGKIFTDVKVTKVTPHAISFLHSNGIAQVLLKDLEPEIQKIFNYDSDKEVEYLQEKKIRNKVIPLKQIQLKKPVKRRVATKTQRIFKLFGNEPKILPQVDLRKRFIQLGLGSKSQGRRPSCAIFSIVSALEFQNAELIGKAEKLSEEYLTWATMNIIQEKQFRNRKFNLTEDESVRSDNNFDSGFRLPEVVMGLRAFGIPLQSQMPNTFGKNMANISKPSNRIIDSARSRQKTLIHAVPGHDSRIRILNMIHLLNEGWPVVVGLHWPNHNTIKRSPILSKQKPRKDYLHAVTLVGYKCESGDIKDIRFIFKNSWGKQWGINGYGFSKYYYMLSNLNVAIFLEVQR